MNYLILVRHGESRWNIANKFTGWVDVPLSENGVQEAVDVAQKIKKLNLDIAFASKLERAQSTLLIILSSQKKTGIFIHDGERDHKWSLNSSKFEKDEIPIFMRTDLNERYYGDLQGMNKEVARKKYGERKVFAWRRSYDKVPPGGESLKHVYQRAVPLFKKEVMPHLINSKNVIISAHGNTLRTIIKHIEDISDEDIAHLELPTAEPIIYKYYRKKLQRVKDGFTFDRPIYWKPPRGNKNNK